MAGTSCGRAALTCAILPTTCYTSLPCKPWARNRLPKPLTEVVQISGRSRRTTCCREHATHVTRRDTLSAILVALGATSLLPTPGQAASFDGLDEEEAANVALFESALPAVVSILDFKARGTAGGLTGAGQGGASMEEFEGVGTGVVWDKYGHVVTNYHVIAKLAEDTKNQQICRVVTTSTKGEPLSLDARLVGFDRNTDLAVLQVDVPSDSRLQPIRLGSSKDLRVGQNCYAIGNPYGLSYTLTAGVVSGMARNIPSPGGVAIPGAIQTDAAISQGNSGGPLLDSSGRAIGINTATFTRKGSGMSSGVNFAIGMDTVYSVVPRLIVSGSKK